MLCSIINRTVEVSVIIMGPSERRPSTRIGGLSRVIVF
jgi:hypothetical protein